MNETTKKIILGGVSVAVIAGAYFLVMKPNMEDTKKIKSETQRLQTTLDDLKAKEARRQEFLDGTAENLALFEDKLAEFPSNWNQEYQIEFVEKVRKNPDIIYNVTGQMMAEPTAYYVLGGTGTVQSADASADATAETAASDHYECYTQTMVLEYVGDYAGVKDFVDHVAAYPYRMTIDNVSISADDASTDYYKGELTVNQYYITGLDRTEQDDIDLTDIETGVDNIFSGGSAQGVVSKYAADNGAAIISDYDLYVAVNPTSSDTSGKVVGLASGSTVTSSKNEAEAIEISVSQDGDTYTVIYGIGTEKQTKEFAPGEDLTLLIQSSDIKDASDVNTANISIENTTDKTLYVKVADDTSARRIKIVNRAGSVIVYK